jgi:CubicO group peptidase (beta-lactamase class C family)
VNRIFQNVTLAVLCCLLQAQVVRAQDFREGLWTAQLHWDAGPSGTLLLAPKGKTWTAKLGSDVVEFPAPRGEIRFAFLNGRGGFRGVRSGAIIRGFWLQPHAAAGDPRDPDGKGQSYAASMVLTRDSGGVWRGAVHPLADSFTLFLKIVRGQDGQLLATFRNPEMNFRLGAPQMVLTRKDDTVIFTDPADPKNMLQATALSADRLRMTLPGIGLVMEFAPATSAQAASFYLRPPGEAPYRYRAPTRTGDGWSVARAAETGMDEAKLAALVQGIIAADPAMRRASLIHSLLIAHRGKLVLEEYFAGYDRDAVHDSRSGAKTFSSVLLGTQMLRHGTPSPGTRLYPLLSAMGPFANPDPRKNEITLAHLMTHTSGLACDDNDDNSPGGEDAVQTQRATPGWWKYTLDLPIAHDPGTRYAYCSPGINLVGAALTTATRRWLPLLFDERVARPLQWQGYYWNLMPDGEGYLGGGVFARPRDMLKLGEAYLDGGVWNGKRLVCAAWVAESTATHVVVSPQTTGLSAENFANVYLPGEDGYGWHITTLHAAGRDYRAYGTSGNGGQLVVVIPSLDLVVGFTGGNYGQGLIWNGWRDKLIPDAIIPAIVR